MTSWRSCLAALVAALLLARPAVAEEAPTAPPPDQRPTLLLMGTVPLYWGESDDLADLVQSGGDPHWARPLLESRYRLVPLDTLSSDRLGRDPFLLMAQPRTLSPGENIALYGWVRAGGRLLLLADPMMTGESRFPIGDRRRPQDVALLSPILTQWGLRLLFDDSALPGLALADAGGLALPVNLPGRFELLPDTTCTLLGDGVAAHCVEGRGEVLVVADAALLDHAGPWPGAEQAVESLLARAFASIGETMHGGGSQYDETPEINDLIGFTVQPPAGEGGPAPPP